MGIDKAEYYDIVGQPDGEDHIEEEDPAPRQQKKGTSAKTTTRVMEVASTVGALLHPVAE